MKFYTEDRPEAGAIIPVAEGVSRLVANNPSLMTYHGTNTYLIERDEGLYVLDPGPVSDENHFNTILEKFAARPAGIIVSHHHSDHFGSVPRLKAVTGAPVYASRVFADDTFRPDVNLDDGDEVAGLLTLHTPGHASDHLCFARNHDGLLFSGDHIMTWSSSMVMLPDGDMYAYCAQLERLIARADKLCLPGHGPVIEDPAPYAQRLLEHRKKRDEDILVAIAAMPATPDDLARRLYGKQNPSLAWAAERNVEAHLGKLEREGRAKVSNGVWSATS